MFCDEKFLVETVKAIKLFDSAHIGSEMDVTILKHFLWYVTLQILLQNWIAV